MMQKKDYSDIIDLPHPVSKTHPRMRMQGRAAQFSPFAALSGHEEACQEVARYTENRRDLTESERERLDKKLKIALEKRDEVFFFTWFIPDGDKEGGESITHEGRIKKITGDKRLILDDGAEIVLKDLLNIAGGCLDGWEFL